MQNMIFFLIQVGIEYGGRKWPHGSGEYFYYSGRPSPTLIHRDMGPFVGQNHRKLSKLFVFGYETGCPIEWAHGWDHFWYTDWLVNSAISWSNMANMPSSVRAFSPFPCQILSLAQARKKLVIGALMSGLLLEYFAKFGCRNLFFWAFFKRGAKSYLFCWKVIIPSFFIYKINSSKVLI